METTPRCACELGGFVLKQRAVWKPALCSLDLEQPASSSQADKKRSKMAGGGGRWQEVAGGPRPAHAICKQAGLKMLQGRYPRSELHLCYSKWRLCPGFKPPHWCFIIKRPKMDRSANISHFSTSAAKRHVNSSVSASVLLPCWAWL